MWKEVVTVYWEEANFAYKRQVGTCGNKEKRDKTSLGRVRESSGKVWNKRILPK